MIPQPAAFEKDADGDQFRSVQLWTDQDGLEVAKYSYKK